MCHSRNGGGTLILQIAHSKVKIVRIYNRPRYGERLNNAKVRVGGQDCNTISAADVTAGKTNNNVIDVKCVTALEGTIVTVTKSGAPLNLMEVEVYGSPLELVPCPAPSEKDMKRGAFHCPNHDIELCLNGNLPIDSLDEAWLQCSEMEECTKIMKSLDGKFYLRRGTGDFDSFSRATYATFDCKQIPQ